MREVGKLAPTILAACMLMLVCVVGVFPNTAKAAFEKCNAKCAASKCSPPTDPKKNPLCSTIKCSDKTNSGVTTCTCVTSSPGFCKGDSFNTPDGKTKSADTGSGALGDFLSKMFGEALKALMQPKPQQPPQQQQQGMSQGFEQQYPPCMMNPATNTVSPIPCREVNGTINYGGTTSGVGTSDLIGGSQTTGSITDSLLNAIYGTETNTNTNTNENTVDVSTGSTTDSSTKEGADAKLTEQQQSLDPSKLAGEIQGDISGGTIYVRSRDPQSNSEVAGFFGGGTGAFQQSQSLLGKMCVSRPWASGLVSFVISPTFFDGLCKRGGYQVGYLVASPSGVVTTTTKTPTITITQPKTQTETTTTTPQPHVDIWADPPNVRLGTRTYIFWTTRDVESCKETGPSFSQTTLTGGAATVPISDASTFTIECTTKDGAVLTDTVRVNLAL